VVPLGFLGWGAVNWLLGFGVHHSDCACGRVFFERGGCDGEGGFEEADGLPGCEAKIVLGIYFAEVAALNIDFLGKGDGVCLLMIVISLIYEARPCSRESLRCLGQWKEDNSYSIRRVLRERCLDHLKVIVRHIIDNNNERLEHKHESWDRKLEILPN